MRRLAVLKDKQRTSLLRSVVEQLGLISDCELVEHLLVLLQQSSFQRVTNPRLQLPIAREARSYLAFAA